MDRRIRERLTPVRQEAAPLRQKIISSLRRAIEIGILAPGDRLIEKDLCEQLDVSRTSLREALRQMQAEGVLSHSSSRSLTVASISAEDAENIYRIRSVLEPLVVEQFIESADDNSLKSLRLESEAMRHAFSSADVEQVMAAKRALYDRICTGARNPIAFDIINRLTLQTSQLRSRSLMRPERQRQSMMEIEALVGAIEARNVEAARRIAKMHVVNAARSALQRDDLSF